MANLFDKKFQKELEEHCGEPKPAAHRPAIEPRPWDARYQSDFSVWQRLTTAFYAFVLIVFTLCGLILFLCWCAPWLLLSAGAVMAAFR